MKLPSRPSGCLRTGHAKTAFQSGRRPFRGTRISIASSRSWRPTNSSRSIGKSSGPHPGWHRFKYRPLERFGGHEDHRQRMCRGVPPPAGSIRRQEKPGPPRNRPSLPSQKTGSRCCPPGIFPFMSFLGYSWGIWSRIRRIRSPPSFPLVIAMRLTAFPPKRRCQPGCRQILDYQRIMPDGKVPSKGI